MKVLKILETPKKVLKEKTKPIKKITPEILTLIENMKYTLIKQENPKGVGLAAPQVGQSLQLFVSREAEDQPFRVWMNPKIELIGAKTVKDEPEVDVLEGCLSIHNLWGVVDRAPIVKITYMDEKGETKTEEVKDLLARIVQHEYDHLQGILFPIRVIEAKKRLYTSTVGDDGDEVFTPVGPSFNI